MRWRIEHGSRSGAGGTSTVLFGHVLVRRILLLKQTRLTLRSCPYLLPIEGCIYIRAGSRACPLCSGPWLREWMGTAWKMKRGIRSRRATRVDWAELCWCWWRPDGRLVLRWPGGLIGKEHVAPFLWDIVEANVVDLINTDESSTVDRQFLPTLQDSPSTTFDLYHIPPTSQA
jgi:hypothetical protein